MRPVSLVHPGSPFRPNNPICPLVRNLRQNPGKSPELLAAGSADPSRLAVPHREATANASNEREVKRMLRRPLMRFVAAASAAGTICALGASAASAAQAATWSGPSKPVPGALTNSSPALSKVAFPNPIGQGLLVAWRGRGSVGHIFYKFRTNTTQRWSHSAEVPGALSSAAPAVGSYIDPLGRNAVLIAWAGHGDNHVWYSQGETRSNGTISFTKPAFLPPSINWTKTFSGPTVFFPNHK